MTLGRRSGSRFGALLMAATLIASACSDSSSDAGPAAAGPTDPPTTIASATTAPVATTVAPTTAAPTTTYPSLSGSTSVTPLDNPLLADPTISLDQPLRPAVHLLGPAGSTPVDLPVPNQPSVEHTLLLAGMRAESTYAVEIELLDDSGATIGRLPDTAFTTGSLPADMPAFRIASSRPDLMQPGFTLFDMIDIRDEMSQTPDDGSIPPPAGWIVMVDNEGQIIWFHNEDHTIGDVRMLPDGSILYEYNDTLAKRINLRGELLDEWAGSIITGRFAVDAHGRTVADESAIKVDVESMHHEQNVLPDGTHATLSTDLRVLDGFTEPQCGEDPADFDGTYHLIGDVVVVFDPVSGDVLHEFNLFDYFDPRADPAAWNLCGLPFDFVFPNWLYRGVDNDARDWTHANAVTADEANNTLIVSVRHLDAVIGIRWKDDANGKAGDLLWHSGPLGNMTLVSGMWHRHQHAPELESDGTILLFDNGNDRPGYGTTEKPLFSRAARFRIDPKASTVEQLWEYRSTIDTQPVFAAFVGDADLLHNDNVLITFGGINGLIDGLSAQIVEVIPKLPEGGDVVWDLRVEGGAGWIVYRSDRVASIFG